MARRARSFSANPGDSRDGGQRLDQLVEWAAAVEGDDAVGDCERERADGGGAGGVALTPFRRLGASAWRTVAAAIPDCAVVRSQRMLVACGSSRPLSR